MTRPSRPDEPGAWHHVMNRGARREPIFRRDDHCLLFLNVLDEAVRSRGIEVHAYCLMPNHFHLLVRSIHGNLSRFMQDLDGNYSRRLNKLESWDGPLFRGRFKSQLITDDVHLKALVPYIHLNPVRAGLVLEPQDFSWASHQAYIGLSTPPPWLTMAYILALFGDAMGLHEAVMGFHRRGVPWPEEMDAQSGWLRIQELRPWGLGAPSSPPQCKAGEPTAQQVLNAVMEVAGASRESLDTIRHGPGGNHARRLAVLALTRLTQLTQREIGLSLGMTSTQVAQILHRFRRNGSQQMCLDLKAAEQKVESGNE